MNKIINITFFCIITSFLVSCRSTKNKISKTNNNIVFSDLEFKKLFHSAMQLKLTGKEDEAYKEFEKCLALNPRDGAINFAISEYFTSKNEMDYAIEFAEQTKRINPKNKWYLKHLANLYISKNEYKKANKIYESIIKEEKDIDLWLSYSKCLIDANENEKAIEILKKIESKFGKSQEIFSSKQDLYLKLGQLEKAEKDILNLIDESPKKNNTRTLLSNFYFKTNQSDKAKKVLDKILEQDSTYWFAHLSLSDYYIKNGNINKVKYHLNKAFLSKEMNLDIKINILENQYKQINGAMDLGEEFNYLLLSSLLKKHPDEAEVYAVKADFDVAYKKIKSARDNYLKAIEIDDTKYAIWKQMLMLSANLNDYNILYEKGIQAIELFPSHPILYLLAGTGANKLKKINESIELLTLGKNYLIDEKELLAEFEFQIAEAYSNKNDFKNACIFYEKTLKIDNDDPVYLNNYAYHLAQNKKDLNKALALSKKATSIKPNNPNYEDTYGWVLFKMERYKEAKNWLKMSLDKNNESSIFNEHYGDVLFKLGNVEKAKKYWLKAKKIGNNSKLLNQKIEKGDYVE